MVANKGLVIMLFLWQKLWLMDGYVLKFKHQIFSYLIKVANNSCCFQRKFGQLEFFTNLRLYLDY